MSTPDTPARATRIPRPQTRRWKRLLSDATSQSFQAAETRTKLREHLAAADKLAAKRRKLFSRRKQPYELLTSIDADWNARVEALKQIADNPKKYDARTCIEVLPVQIADVRSAVVVQAAETCVAFAAFMVEEEVVRVFQACADGAAITKKVMADARRKAALAVVSGRQEEDVWAQIATYAESQQTSVRVLCLDAMCSFVGSGEKESILQIAKEVVCVSARDREAQVREGGKKFVRLYRERFGNEAKKEFVDSLPKDVASRVGGVKKAAAGRMSMRDVMKQKREQMRKQKNAGNLMSDNIAIGKRKLEGDNEPKRQGIAANDQENRSDLVGS